MGRVNSSSTMGVGHLWIGFTLAAAISSCAADAGSSIAVAHVRSADLAATLSTPAAQAAAQTAWLKVRSMRPDQFAEATLSSLSDQPVTIDSILFKNSRSAFASQMATWRRLAQLYPTMAQLVAKNGLQVAFTMTASDLHDMLDPKARLALLDQGDPPPPITLNEALGAGFLPPTNAALYTYNWFKSNPICSDIYHDMDSNWYHPYGNNSPPPAYSYAQRLHLNVQNQGQMIRESQDVISQQWSFVAQKIDQCSLTAYSEDISNDPNKNDQGKAKTRAGG